jgi:ABC-type Zn uptake system ZnuABC Zn-binding protein ZnuA
MTTSTTIVTRRAVLGALALGAAVGLAGAAGAVPAESPIEVCATTPDLGSLVQAVGGDQVTLTVLAKPGEDPHFLEAKPSFVTALHRSDLLVLTGLDLEIGYLPVLTRTARNGRVLPGAEGYVDASTVIRVREVPTGPVDRSMGDVHAYGNPHYLLDPLNGVRVAALLRDRLTAARPAQAGAFAQRYEAFRRRVAEAMLGAELAQKYEAEWEKLVRLHEYGRMLDWLREKGDDAALGGWLGALARHHGATALADHNLWTYLAARFGITMLGNLEPRPGIPPTTRHLADLVASTKARGVRLILASPYYDPKHAQFMAAQTGAKVVPLAHQPGSRDATDDYVAMLDYDVRQLAAALGGA